MLDNIAGWLEARFGISTERTEKFFQRGFVGVAALGFVVTATLVVAFDDIFVGVNTLSRIKVGDIAPFDIVAPQATRFTSTLLTEDAKQKAGDAVQPIFDPPDPNVARQQSQLATNILTFIKDVRADSYGTPEQKLADLDSITALSLNEAEATAILSFTDENWDAIGNEVTNVMSLVMRESIRPNNMDIVRDQLSNQVSIRFNQPERDIIVAIVEDLVRPNTFENATATEDARNQAVAQVDEVTRAFVRGELLVSSGEVITALNYEALQALDLLTPPVLDVRQVVSVFTLTTITMVIVGLYVIRFDPLLVYRRVRMLSLLATIFLIMLVAVRILGVNGSVYLFPSSSLALLFVAIVGLPEAIIGTVALALLTGFMANYSLEVVTLILAGGLIGALTLRRTERLNSFFISGGVIGFVNAAVVAIFKVAIPNSLTTAELLGLILTASLSGLVLVPATAIAAMYLVTTMFNLPTALKLLDLSQPSKPLLQRLLREAPGTYQHSLQVANLAEQAATKIGADAQLTHVAALYHDIGKMENPLFFTENLHDPTLNPHDTLNDPYRSASIIIEHVTKGDEMGRQYGLPHRIRDFIMEHHGTTQVFVFYQRAINQADGDASAVDINDFTYPGPKPRSRETAILMLADSCEATVRSVKPQSRQEIADLVDKIMDDKRKSKQLDDSNLTLTDLEAIRTIFIDILQSMFHPRINYFEAVAKKTANPSMTKTSQQVRVEMKTPTRVEKLETIEVPLPKRTSEMPISRPIKPLAEIGDEEPMSEVPRLPRAEDIKPPNGKSTTPQSHEEDQIE